MPPSVASDAPPISIRWVGPQSVTSWPNRRCQMSSSGKPLSAKAPQAAIIRPPTGAHQSPPRWMAVLAGRSRAGHDDRQHARHEHAVEADQDQVVGRVGERARVAAVVDVQRDVPVHAEHGDEQRDAQQHRRHRRPGRQPGVALGPAAEAVEDVRATAPVARDQEHDERGRDERAGGGADRLSERGAAGRLRAVGLRNAGPAAASMPITPVAAPIIPPRMCLAPRVESRIKTGFPRTRENLTDRSVS